MTALSAATSRRFQEIVGERLDASPLLVMLDVDGTLAPIAPTPADARVPRPTREVVANLAASPSVTVALVSGRAADAAWRMAGVPGAWVVGNHGFELRHPDGEVRPDDRARGFDEAVATAARALRDEFRDVRGVIVEDKRWTLSLHYRLVEESLVPRVVKRAEELGAALGLRAMPGKKIVELRPPLDINKGTASLSLLERFGISAERGGAMYAGDDRTDEDAFEALRGAVPGALTVRVVPDDVRAGEGSHAEVILGSLEELRSLLEWTIARRARSTSR